MAPIVARVRQTPAISRKRGRGGHSVEAVGALAGYRSLPIPVLGSHLHRNARYDLSVVRASVPARLTMVLHPIGLQANWKAAATAARTTTGNTVNQAGS